MGILDGLRSLDELSLENQRVFVRLDLDTTLHGDKLDDDASVQRALPTIQKVQRAGARVILGARVGEPNGRVNAALSLEPFAARLSELLQADVYLPDECVGDAARKVVQDLRPGQLCLLENLDFAPEEGQNDDSFARELLRFADVYVNDALVDTRARRASTDALPRMVRERGMGYAFAAELAAIAKVTETPQRPLLLVAGGEDAAGGLDWLKAMLDRANLVLAAGAVGNALLAARGSKLGATPIEAGTLARGRSLLTTARDRNIPLLLPTDLVAAEGLGALAGRPVPAASVPESLQALDIGPETRAAFAAALGSAKTVLWNGPLGSAQNPAFGAGTLAFAQALADSPAFGLVLGSDTVHALRRADAEVTSRIGFVSAGGRASLDLVEGRRLPGIEALRGGAT